MRDQVERHKTEIARLQDEIAAYLNQIEQQEAAVKTESEKLDKAKSGFERTHQSVMLQIDGDIEKIHQYL